MRRRMLRLNTLGRGLWFGVGRGRRCVVGTGQRIGAENRWRSIAPVSPGALVGYVFCELMPTLCLGQRSRMASWFMLGADSHSISMTVRGESGA